VGDLNIIARVAARFASDTLAKGDLLEVWMKRGDWWTEMRRGVKLEVKDVQGDTVRVQHQGWAEGKGWEMKLAPGTKGGKFTLEDTGKFKRSLVVKKV
jgi:hypothetical protein